MNHTDEAWEEEQMCNLGCESVSDLIAEVKRLREVIYDALYLLQTYGWNNNRADAINRLEKVFIKGWKGEEE